MASPSGLFITRCKNNLTYRIVGLHALCLESWYLVIHYFCHVCHYYYLPCHNSNIWISLCSQGAQMCRGCDAAWCQVSAKWEHMDPIVKHCMVSAVSPHHRLVCSLNGAIVTLYLASLGSCGWFPGIGAETCLFSLICVSLNCSLTSCHLWTMVAPGWEVSCILNPFSHVMSKGSATCLLHNYFSLSSTYSYAR